MRLERIHADRYIGAVTTSSSRPLRVASADGREWLLKLRSTGHGVKALVAEILTSGLARAIGLAVPELAIPRATKAKVAWLDALVENIVLGDEVVEMIVGSVPCEWASDPTIYFDWLKTRLAISDRATRRD